MRLERAFLLEQLHKHMEYNIDDSDRSSSPPPTPTEKPLRSKRSHRQKTPPQGGAPLGTTMSSAQQPSPGSLQHQQVMHTVNPMSSAQSTPDPNRTAPFFSTIPPPASSPHAVNGTGQPVLPPLSSHLPPLQPQRPPESSRGAFYDPTTEEPRATEDDAEFAGRRRAHSSAHAPPSESQDAPAPSSQNGDRRDQDTEMGGASAGGFTAVNQS